MIANKIINNNPKERTQQTNNEAPALNDLTCLQDKDEANNNINILSKSS